MRLVEHAWSRLALVVAVTTLVACGGADDDDSNTAATDAPVTSAAPRTTTTSVTATTAPAVPDLAAARVTLTEVAHDLASPVAFATRAGDDRFYVAEQGGRVRIVDHGETVEEPVLEVDVSGGNEQGLLGLVVLARRHEVVRRLHRSRTATRTSSSTR